MAADCISTRLRHLHDHVDAMPRPALRLQHGYLVGHAVGVVGMVDITLLHQLCSRLSVSMTENSATSST